ncbi:biotin-independent malonate decarboxylase subunit beta [Streptomyces sp. J2-1]|uniref:biotin-independent malonate decarboxylase subunit beta n=1 Tax=Streptomyces corallincola TaxID=2851888 RepID=UPI001C37FC1F|nr:biotin-independent malonate decarboxylase subunit beta [Streptomyces corallincola]MBV2353877.1 biotin-independent malonate decarboxylase subunit beta [Streptomyces corallincola]
MNAQTDTPTGTVTDTVRTPAVVLKDAFTELSARERAASLLDEGTFRELLGPFERLESPHLAPQGIVPQSDDGAVVARGTLGGERAVVVALDGKFQGGGIGEVNGAKLAAALELAADDWESGKPIRPVVLLETGGIRLQEANLGLLAIADIHAAIVRLRQYTPVVGVVAGMVGCFGGMGIAAGLCTDLVVTRQGRLGLNGPEVIEQEAGVEEFDSRDRALVWATIGGAARAATGLAERLVDDDVSAVADAVHGVFAAGGTEPPRSARVEDALALLARIDPARRLTARDLAELSGLPSPTDLTALTDEPNGAAK